MSRTGGQIDPCTRRIEQGRMPRGSVEDCQTIKDGPMRIFRRKPRR